MPLARFQPSKYSARSRAGNAGDEQRRHHADQQHDGHQRPQQARRPAGGAVAQRPEHGAGNGEGRQRPIGDVLVQDVAAEEAEPARRPTAVRAAPARRAGRRRSRRPARCGCSGCATARRPRTRTASSAVPTSAPAVPTVSRSQTNSGSSLERADDGERHAHRRTARARPARCPSAASQVLLRYSQRSRSPCRIGVSRSCRPADPRSA